MTEEEIREGDIVEIDYIAEFTKEHINEGKALVIWKGSYHQPLVRKLDTKTTIWTCYEHIARVVGHIDIKGYMDKLLDQEPCEDCISREQAKVAIRDRFKDLPSRVEINTILNELPSVRPQPKTGHWEWLTEDKYRCSNCNHETRVDECMNEPMYDFCPYCGCRMKESEVKNEKNTPIFN